VTCTREGWRRWQSVALKAEGACHFRRRHSQDTAGIAVDLADTLRAFSLPAVECPRGCWRGYSVTGRDSSFFSSKTRDARRLFLAFRRGAVLLSSGSSL
jgi:hypothetical protein